MADYELGYLLAHWNAEGLATEHPPMDAHALSVGFPVSLDPHRARTWPAFLIDLMPQGHVRRRIAADAARSGALARSTKWRVMAGRDFHPGWPKIAEAAVGDAVDQAKLKWVLKERHTSSTTFR